MIRLVERLLQRLKVIAAFDKDDVLNASIDDKVRDNEKVIEKIQAQLQKRFATNERLRESIKIARRRTNSFEAFEQHMVGRNDD